MADLLEQLLAIKAEGNEEYKKQAYPEAIAAYSRAVKLLPDLDDEEDAAALPPELCKQAAIILCNRSASYLYENKAVKALADAQLAADFDAMNWKSHWRQGLALMKMEPRLERSEKAVAAFDRTLACDSLPASERENALRAKAAAEYRLREGRDALDMPSMENCVVS